MKALYHTRATVDNFMTLTKQAEENVEKYIEERIAETRREMIQGATSLHAFQSKRTWRSFWRKDRVKFDLAKVIAHIEALTAEELEDYINALWHGTMWGYTDAALERCFPTNHPLYQYTIGGGCIPAMNYFQGNALHTSEPVIAWRGLRKSIRKIDFA